MKTWFLRTAVEGHSECNLSTACCQSEHGAALIPGARPRACRLLRSSQCLYPAPSLFPATWTPRKNVSELFPVFRIKPGDSPARFQELFLPQASCQP